MAERECPADRPTCSASGSGHQSDMMEHGITGHPTSATHTHYHHHVTHQEPGPMPGVRPPMGGAGGIIPPPQGKGSGAMGIIMPLYTVGIVVFFVYTIMKVLFKKGQEDDKTPKLKDFGLDPEYRKYVFAEEYLDNADVSTKDQFRRQQREESRSRRKYQPDQQAEAKIAGKGWKSQNKMDTKGKKLGEWYLPEGFLSQIDDESDDEAINVLIGGTTVDESARETYRDRLIEGLYMNTQQQCKRKSKSQLQNQRLKTKEKSQCRSCHGLALKKWVCNEPMLKRSFTEEDINYMYSNQFFQELRNVLEIYDTKSSLNGEGLEELCLVARDHLCNTQHAPELSGHQHPSQEKVQCCHDDLRIDSPTQPLCGKRLMINKRRSEQTISRPCSSRSESLEKSMDYNTEEKINVNTSVCSSHGEAHIALTGGNNENEKGDFLDVLLLTIGIYFG